MLARDEVMRIPSELKGILVSTPDTLHGAVRFAGSRVFVQQLFDYIFAGESLDDFIEDFPEISRQKAEAVLEWERNRLSEEFSTLRSA